ncbi:separase isoform X2 [Humulus lupulus]|uniref:separase isoform X2 n=1 Tax=Humulus lupulus TaxID=3486 RepID=UPI002B405DB9|nr:separase isoform X2 [Humulus lupulus]
MKFEDAWTRANSRASLTSAKPISHPHIDCSSLPITLSAMDTSLISKLEASDSVGIYCLFSHHLRSFSDLKNLKKTKKSTASKDEQSLARSLAKSFLPFLNTALSVLPKRLAEPSKFGAEQLAVEFFDVYRLCLDCLDSVSSQLDCKPHTVQAQRVRMVHCLDTWGRWKEAEEESLRVLEGLRSVSSGAESAKSERSLLPVLGKGSADKSLGLLIVEIVVTLVKCASMDRSKGCEDFRRVLLLMEEARPWFRVLDANAYEKLHRILVSHLGRCTLLIVGDLTIIDDNLARDFCFTTMAEHAKSLTKDQMYKFARRLCSSLFSLQDSRSTLIIDILIGIMDSLAHDGKVEMENNAMEFVELVAYCANKCQAKSPNICNAIGAYLNKIADDFDQVKTPFCLILRLYAKGLLFMHFKLKSRCNDPASSGGVIKSLCDSVDTLKNLSCLLCSLESYFNIGCQNSCQSSSDDFKDATCLLSSPCISQNEACTRMNHKDGKAYLLSYLTALKYICLPLAESVNSEKKEIIIGSEAAAVSSKLSDIQGVLDQFCNVFLFCKRCKCTSEGERDGFDESSILSIAVALFIVSIRTSLNMQKSVHLLKDVISSEWIQPQGLKYLYCSLYNIGVILYRNKQLKEASKALKLSCTSSWTYVLHLCDMVLRKPEESISAEDSIINFVNESCTKTAFLLEVLHQCDSNKMKKVIAESLENWSVAANLFSKLPGPMPLVKQWVKNELKRHKNADVEDAASSLYHVLSSSKEVSKRAMGVILEQELLAYEQVTALQPELCQRMQMKIIGHLLEELCVTSESWLQRSKILMIKGRTLRLNGMHCLKDCIQCMSEAISLILLKQKVMSGGKSSYGVEPSHQLAVAHCLRAFCTQEAEPNSKQVLEDIRMAINLWLSIITPDCFSAEEKCFGVFENMIILLYSIIDLLSVKGCMGYHNDIYKLMIRLFHGKGVPLEKFFAVLWEGRRTRHALCISPVNDAFLKSLADHYDEDTKSIDFWIKCLKGSRPLLVGFQHSFSCLSANFPRGSLEHESFFCSDIREDEVEKVAFELISNAPASSSVFVASNLFYDLSEKLISNGHITKALFYAKQAHRLRNKIFEEKFKFSVKHHTEMSNETREVAQKFTYSLQDLQVRRSVANDFWSFDSISWDLESCYLSPWIALQCYLESTLQVGITYELMGNGSEAESLFLWGKSISYAQNLSLFMIAFSSVLGMLYCKKQLWDLAERELQGAKQYFDDRSSEISCLKCRLMLKITIDQHLVDLSQSIMDNSSRKLSMDTSLHAETLYKSAIDQLNHSDWTSSASLPKEASAGNIVLQLVKDVDYSVSNTSAHTEEAQQDINKPSRKGPKEKKEVKSCRNTRNLTKVMLKDQDLMPEKTFRSTRSKNQSFQNKNISSNIQVGGENDSSGTFSERDSVLEIKTNKIAFGSEDICFCNKMRCWHCVHLEVTKNGLIVNAIDMKWEFVRRKLLLKLLTSLGNYFGNRGQIHEAHEIYFQVLSIIVNQGSFHLTSSSISLSHMLDIIRKEIPGDILSVERAEVLYNISWFSLKGYHSRDTRNSCCDLSHIQPQHIISWLMHAFVLCQEVPILFQKVSRLLAVMFVLAASGELCSLSSSKEVSESHWASYFHQASLGSHLNYQIFTNNNGRHKVQHLVDAEDSSSTGSTCRGAEMQKPRFAPKSTQDFEEYVENFFQGLPCTTAICTSMLGGSFANLLQEVLQQPSCVSAWMLVSRLDSKSQPIVVLLPVDSILEVSDDAESSGSSNLLQKKDSGKHWQCPWGSTVVDDVAPEFKLILEENYLSTSTSSLEDTKENRKLWWSWRKNLDHRLGEFLRKVEDIWLGPWKYLLLGERSSCKHLESVQKKLTRYLKSKCKLDVNESLLKVILGAPSDAFDEEGFTSQLYLSKACYIGRIGCCEKLSSLALEQICEAVKELESDDFMDRQPIVLILDSDVQMLPWENIPILRTQEVYRMPSIWSISARLDKSYHDQVRSFPFIDPLDAFYLLNPDGDLSCTQNEFENWFKDQQLEGQAGVAPTAEELAVALKSHDLFIYFGHGSGAQYIPRHEIQKLENCAATLLMGCSSGSLTLNGCYVPHGTPLSYLLAGSPAIIANLWDVTDKDIDRFGKAMLDAWLKERLGTSSGCDKCNVLSEELEALSLKGKGNAKRKISKKKLAEASELDLAMDCCYHRPKIGSFMGQARQACTLPFLIGASPVCYGVPTGIRNKKDL